MKIVKSETRTVANNEVWYYPLAGNATGNTVIGEVYFFTTTNIPFTVSASPDGTNFKAVKVIDMADYAVKNSITTAGYYMIPTAGLNQLKMEFGGSGDVFVKAVF